MTYLRVVLRANGEKVMLCPKPGDVHSVKTVHGREPEFEANISYPYRSDALDEHRRETIRAANLRAQQKEASPDKECGYEPSSPAYSPTSPAYSPTSPKYEPMD